MAYFWSPDGSRLAYVSPSEEPGTLRWTVEQGFEMGRPSIIHVEADVSEGSVTEIRVGGTSVMVSEGEMYL